VNRNDERERLHATPIASLNGLNDSDET
jgi:hypothetical protein